MSASWSNEVGQFKGNVRKNPRTEWSGVSTKTQTAGG